MMRIARRATIEPRQACTDAETEVTPGLAANVIAFRIWKLPLVAVARAVYLAAPAHRAGAVRVRECRAAIRMEERLATLRGPALALLAPGTVHAFSSRATPKDSC